MRKTIVYGGKLFWLNIKWMERSSDVVAWCPIFRRNLLQSEESSLFSRLELLGGILILEEGYDFRF